MWYIIEFETYRALTSTAKSARPEAVAELAGVSCILERSDVHLSAQAHLLFGVELERGVVESEFVIFQHLGHFRWLPLPHAEAGGEFAPRHVLLRFVPDEVHLVVNINGVHSGTRQVLTIIVGSISLCQTRPGDDVTVGRSCHGVP